MDPHVPKTHLVYQVVKVVIGLAAVVLIWFSIRQYKPTVVSAIAGQSSRYEVIEDEMGGQIKIAVPAEISEQDLRATLIKAANDHQDDIARDYLTSFYLFVDAYLVKDGKRSGIAAGQLRRYIPFADPEKRKKMTTDRTRMDEFKSTLDLARRSLLK